MGFCYLFVIPVNEYNNKSNDYFSLFNENILV